MNRTMIAALISTIMIAILIGIYATVNMQTYDDSHITIGATQYSLTDHGSIRTDKVINTTGFTSEDRYQTLTQNMPIVPIVVTPKELPHTAGDCDQDCNDSHGEYVMSDNYQLMYLLRGE